MNVVFITPAAAIRKTLPYRIGNSIYTRPNAITGPLILATILKKAGHRSTVYEDLYASVKLDQVIADADVVGLSTMTSTAPRAYEIADGCRARGKRVIIGGFHASVMPDEAAAHADTVVAGEAESVIVDVVEGKLPDKIVKAPLLSNLDSVVFPDYSLMKTPCREANIMTTRGCHFSCNFCSTSRMFTPYRERSVDNVIAEISWYKERGFKFINFQDDNFTGNRTRAKAILTKMIENNLLFNDVFFFGRADIVQDEELLSLLSRARLRSVLIGFESLNPNALKYVGKKIELAPLLESIRNLGRYKIKLLASLVLGLDTDGIAEMRNAVGFCRKINAYTLQPAVLTPFPGTPVHGQYESEQRMLTREWQYFDMMHATFAPKRLSGPQLQREFYRALTSFYSLSGALAIARAYGFAAGLRRVGLWIVFAVAARIAPMQDRRFHSILKRAGAKEPVAAV